MRNRSLVLSYIEGYSAHDVAPFVETLRASGYTGDIVFFTFNVADDCSALFAAHDVRQISVFRFDLRRRFQLPEWLARGMGMTSNSFIPDRSINVRLSRLFRRLHLGDTKLAWTVAKMLWHCQSARFFYFQEFLEAHPQYTEVMISDARDVIFQRDPFAFNMRDQLYVFEEYPETPLGEQRENAGWVESLHGRAALEQISEFPVICVGVLLGRRAPLLRSLREVTTEIITNHIGWGTDSGVPNYFIRTGRLDNVKVVPYGSGPAMHVGIAPRDTICTDDRGRVLNREGEVCNIIHQYDRHPDLVRTFPAQSAASVVQPTAV